MHLVDAAAVADVDQAADLLRKLELLLHSVVVREHDGGTTREMLNERDQDLDLNLVVDLLTGSGEPVVVVVEKVSDSLVEKAELNDLRELEHVDLVGRPHVCVGVKDGV